MRQDDSTSWRVTIAVPAPAIKVFEAALGEVCEVVSSFEDQDVPGRWIMYGDGAEAPEMAHLKAFVALAATSAGIAEPAFSIAEIKPTDWVAEVLTRFPPIKAGRYFIHGSHFTDKPPRGRIALEIDAATAFGSGEHQTTRGCLLALDRLARDRTFVNVLDMGCGTAVLAMAAARTWEGARVLAADIDAEAVRVAKGNIAGNGLSARIAALRSNGYKAARIARDGPFDLIVANILMRPLCVMAGDLRRHLAPGGVAILSGFYKSDAARVLESHETEGLSLVRPVDVGPWRTLVLAG